MFRWNFNVPEGVLTLPANRGNQITKDYYDFLVGEINRGVIKKAVAKATHISSGAEFCYLISY